MIKDEIRFYFCMLLGYSLMMIGIWTPPVGVISNSVIVAAGILLCIGALAVGIDLKGCLEELTKLKDINLREREVRLKEKEHGEDY